MYANSRQVASTQAGIHERLAASLQRHAEQPFRKPIAAHTQAAFDAALKCWDGRRPLILDAGCGVGWSTLALGQAYPEACVFGVDQSADRIGRGKPLAVPANVHFVRGDLVDFWRLMRRAGLRLQRHYLLYPNPWPKHAHLGRRWQGHAVLPDLLALGGQLELRTNWKLYAEEFAFAVHQLCGISASLEAYAAPTALTPFERKYRDSGQTLWRLTADLRAWTSV